MSKIILINGKKRSGKDHCAQILKERLEDSGLSVFIVAFADPIKEIIATVFNMSLELLNVFKNDQKELYVVKEDATDEELFLGDNLVKISDFRTILQRFGTEAMQEMFGKNVWVDLLKKRAENSGCDFIIVPDFRFIAENIGDVTIKVRNDDLKDSGDKHASEIELDRFDFDYEINNTGKPDVQQEISLIASKIILEYSKFLVP